MNQYPYTSSEEELCDVIRSYAEEGQTLGESDVRQVRWQVLTMASRESAHDLHLDCTGQGGLELRGSGIYFPWAASAMFDLKCEVRLKYWLNSLVHRHSLPFTNDAYKRRGQKEHTKANERCISRLNNLTEASSAEQRQERIPVRSVISLSYSLKFAVAYLVLLLPTTLCIKLSRE